MKDNLKFIQTQLKKNITNYKDILGVRYDVEQEVDAKKISLHNFNKNKT